MRVGDGTVLGDRYELERVIGRGGMADVYRATDRVLARQVAVKLLREVTGDASDRARFAAEARTLAQLSHPSLVTVLDAGTDVERPYLVLELVDGPSLADVLPDRLPADRAARIGADVAAALAHVHAAGIVHRDVKPGNVLLGRDGRARLTDFGIARLLADSVRHTKTGFTIGTAAYLAPEQVHGETVTPAADVYSLGLVLIEALTGERVFQGSATEAALARLHAAPAVPDHLPARWRSALVEMTRLEAGDRPTAEQVAEALATISEDPAAAAHRVADGLGSTRILPAAQPATRPAPPPGEAATTRVPRGPGAGIPGWFAMHRGVLVAVLAAVVLAVAVALPVALSRDPSGGGSGVPDEVPARFQEPLTDLHDAVHGGPR